MGNYTIRFAEYDDIPAIMNYIDNYWKKGHILAVNQALFKWQYVNHERVNFVIGLNEENNICGILGFIPYSADDDKDIALALWKARHSESFLGIRLILFLKKQEKHRNIVCTGINLKTTSKIYKQLGMKVGVMKQWYRLRKGINYRVAKINNEEIPGTDSGNCELELLSEKSELKNLDIFGRLNETSVPFKSPGYFEKRYFDHPVYKYLAYVVKNGCASTAGLIVLRVQEYMGAKVFRFVDFIGEKDVLLGITDKIDRLMEEHETEYIDMYEAGLNDNILIRAGWKPVKGSGNIIPNYFAPYQQSVEDIYYCASADSAVLFRGDGDQDRPN